MIRDTIVEKLDIQIQKSTSNTFLIADLGCSVGPNTFFAMQNVIEAIKEKYHSLNSESPEFQVFFNDHATNDFNTLFESLPSDERPYKFAAAVPGSFYGRLFPSCSLHFAYSCYALHYLSESPEELIDKNKGKIHYEGAAIEVWNAYAAQYDKDMEVFLSARAEEIVPGGLLVFTVSAIPSDVHHSKLGYRIFTFLESSLIDMVNEGIADESLVDSFNLPLYFTTAEDMAKMVKKNGCFSLERIELLYLQSMLDAKSFITHLKAGLEGIFTKHFGSTIADEMFVRTLGKSEEITSWMKDEYYKTARQLLVVLKRNK